MIRVLVVAALPAVRAGLAALVAGDDISIAGQNSTVRSPLATLGEPAADVLILDPTGGAAEVEDAAISLPGLPIVVLGPVPDETRVLDTFAGRAWAYLPRDASGEVISAAVRAVAGGLVAIAPGLANRVIGPAGTPAPQTAPGEDLTPREREVIQLIAMGLPNKTIANRLKISEHTVKFHVASILTRLGAASRTEAVRLGARRGLVTL